MLRRKENEASIIHFLIFLLHFYLGPRVSAATCFPLKNKYTASLSCFSGVKNSGIFVQDGKKIAKVYLYIILSEKSHKIETNTLDELA